MRFLENHDEDRISSVYGSYEKTKPVATAYMLAPGMPMIYAGQEVGFGLGISNYDGRRRGVIDWNFGGKPVLQAHYQRLATIRGTFPEVPIDRERSGVCLREAVFRRKRASRRKCQRKPGRGFLLSSGDTIDGDSFRRSSIRIVRRL